MSVKRQITEPDGVYFITFTCHQWMPLIAQTNSYDLIYNWFDHLKSKGHYVAGYVIMPNHVHALIAFRNTDQNINTIVGNGKRFIAYEIIKRLKAQGENKLLHQLHFFLPGVSSVPPVNVSAHVSMHSHVCGYGTFLLPCRVSITLPRRCVRWPCEWVLWHSPCYGAKRNKL
jgi:REP element-mobilizing transposase RayT